MFCVCRIRDNVGDSDNESDELIPDIEESELIGDRGWHLIHFYSHVIKKVTLKWIKREFQNEYDVIHYVSKKERAHWMRSGSRTLHGLLPLRYHPDYVKPVRKEYVRRGTGSEFDTIEFQELVAYQWSQLARGSSVKELKGLKIEDFKGGGRLFNWRETLVIGDLKFECRCSACLVV